jgi:hypothetical protein
MGNCIKREIGFEVVETESVEVNKMQNKIRRMKLKVNEAAAADMNNADKDNFDYYEENKIDNPTENVMHLDSFDEDSEPSINDKTNELYYNILINKTINFRDLQNEKDLSMNLTNLRSKSQLQPDSRDKINDNKIFDRYKQFPSKKDKQSKINKVGNRKNSLYLQE